MIRVLSSIRIFSSAFYPSSAFSHPRFILHPYFLIRHPYPPSISASKNEGNKKNHDISTVEPPLSGPPLSGHTLLNGHLSKSQKYLLYINKQTTSIKRPPLLSGRGHLPTVPNSVFYEL